MSINQAAIHYNLPYSSLYGRFKRGKYDAGGSANNSNVGIANTSTGSNSGGAPGANTSSGTIEIIEHSPENSVSYCFFFFQKDSAKSLRYLPIGNFNCQLLKACNIC